ncbi:MAG: hypothetical protein ACREON_15900 [Gemmatimonadaceae bacterium]
MRRIAAAAVVAAIVALGACEKTGEGEFQVQTPDVDVNADTTTIRTPSVDVTKDTITMEVPKVDVKTPSERKQP